MNLTSVIAYVREITARMGLHRASLSAGGLAYFVVLALAPAAVVVGSMAGLLLTPTEIREAFARLQEASPSLAANVSGLTDALVSVVENASATAFTVTTIVSVIVAVYAASKVVYGIRLAQDTSYGAVSSDRTLIVRGISAVITLAALVVVAALIVALTFVPRILDAFGLHDVRIVTGIAAIDWAVLAIVVWLLVRLTMGHLTASRQRIPIAALGPIAATVVIAGATLGVGIYAHFSSTLSAAILVFGSPVIVLLWLYLCFLGLILGSEMEAVRREHGRRLV
ncbi:MAG: Virulence factor BrkB [Actinomycetota bacterium]